MKLSWCHNRLAIGSSREADEESAASLVQKFHDAGVTHLINCRRNQVHAKSLDVLNGVVILWNPVEDDGQPKPPEWFGRSIDFALGALANPHHRVCVSCCNGDNRAPSTALAILLAQGLTFDEALRLVLKARPEAEVCYRQDALTTVRLLGYC